MRQGAHFGLFFPREGAGTLPHVRATPQCGVYTYCHTHNYSTTPHTGEGPRAQRQVFGLSTVYKLYGPWANPSQHCTDNTYLHFFSGLSGIVRAYIELHILF